jgi:hypothetical protein
MIIIPFFADDLKDDGMSFSERNDIQGNSSWNHAF